MAKTKSKAQKTSRPSRRQAVAIAIQTAAPADWAVLAEDLLHPMRIADLAGNTIYANPQYQLAIAPATAEPDAPTLAAITQQLETSGELLQFDLRLNLLDRVYVYRTRHVLRRGPDGSGFVISSFADITEQDFLRHRLQLTQSRMEDLIKLTSDWVWEVDANFKLVAASPRIAELCGWHVRELLGRDFFTLLSFAENFIDPLSQRPKPLLEYMPFRDLPCQIANRAGAAHHLKLAGMPQFDRTTGQFMGYRGTAADVTKMLAAERQAALLERRLTTAITSMTEGFALFNPDGVLIVANPIFGDFFAQSDHLITPGIAHDEMWSLLIRRGDVDISGWQLGDWLLARREHFDRARKPFEIKLTDGRILLAHDHRTDDGSTVCVLIDVTDQKRREAELIVARRNAEVANKTKGEFFAKMSHELRTPLNAIIGFSDVMTQEKLGPLGASAYKSYAQDINESAGHLLQLINDILDVAKAEAGKLELQEQDISLDSTVQASVRMLHERASTQMISIDAQAIDKELVLHGDGKKIRQVLINLLSNAIKFTPPGGSITITAGTDADGVFITVRDTGIGMDPEDIPKVLTPFSQVDNNVNRHYDGTGLGLPLSLALVELHGGTLHIDSALGRGTTITVHLPPERIVR